MKGSVFYPILDYDYCRRFDLNPASLPAIWYARGLNYYQLRFKNASPADYLTMARDLRSRVPGSTLIANDHWEAALEHPEIFQGLHLGQEDFAALAASEIGRLSRAARGALKAGISTHNMDQLLQALNDDFMVWDYIAVGPIATTGSKPTGTDPVISETERTQIFQRLADEFRQLPHARRPGLVLIGGLTSETLDKIISADFRRQYGFMPIIAAIAAAAREEELTRLLEKLPMYNA